MYPRNHGKTQHVEIVTKGIEDVARRAYMKINGELILRLGTIKMLAMIGETAKIIEICNEVLDYFEQAAEHPLHPTGGTVAREGDDEQPPSG